MKNQTNSKNKILELYILLMIDLAALFLSYLLALLLRYGTAQSFLTYELHYSIFLCLLLMSVLYSLLLDWNQAIMVRGYLVEFFIVLKYNSVIIVLTACFLYITGMAADFSRLIWGYTFVFNMLLTYIGHILAKVCLRRYYNSRSGRVGVLVVTDVLEPIEMVERLKKAMPMNYDITTIAYTGDRKDILEKCEKLAMTISGEDLIEQAKQMPFDEVFIHVKNMEMDQVNELVKAFELMGVICHYSLDSLDILDRNPKESKVGKFGDYVVVSYSLSQIDSRRGLIKRLMDIAGGIIGLLLTGIMFPFVAIAIKTTSKGPIFFSQVRIGKNGRRFKIYKFRSMYLDAEEKKKILEEHNEMSGYMFKIKNDPRITPVGKFLRKTSIDEFPQFFNVLKGDMSLIGTRPPTVNEFEKYSPYYRRRLCVKPGLTGLWQVSGRSNIKDFDEVVKLDLEYIDTWSLTLDIKILLKTIYVVFTGRGSD